MPCTISPDAPITDVPGIGPKKAECYVKLGIYTVRQLLLHLPRTYRDLRRVEDLDEIPPNDGKMHLIRAIALSKSSEQRIRRGLSIFHLRATSDGTILLLTFYNMQYTVRAIPLEKEIFLYGTVSGSLLRREMKNPEVLSEETVGSFSPLYPSIVGLSSKAIEKNVHTVLGMLNNDIDDAIPKELENRYALPSFAKAVHMAHLPQSEEEIEKSRRRITLSSLFSYSAAMLSLRGSRKKVLPFPDTEVTPFLQSLPYVPTGAQQRAIEDICHDLQSGHVMNRLVQGDVGCGKTLVAAAAIYCAVKNGCQAALMAPTEILAEQHRKTFSNLFAPFSIRIGFLTGSLSASQHREILQKVKNGEISLLIGTHALFQSGVEFSRLGMVITDEQHRFGVAQRAALSAKGEGIHTLVMSATPIPRTMTLLLYGDLDLSVIDEMPAGRQKVTTYCIGSDKRARALGYLRRHLDAGLQGYIVCPLVEKSENAADDLLDAATYEKKLADGELAGYRVGLLHGKMKPKEKDDVMRQFAAGEIQVLVATTVVEVGVDVANAAVMIIENAERFGLSQLHQLRGRVGRGTAASCCILISDSRSENSRERLKILTSTNDGFRIAEEDLRLRGPGEILGLRQHGLPNIDLVSDPKLFSVAQEAATEILRQDPDLIDHPALKKEVSALLKNTENALN